MANLNMSFFLPRGCDLLVRCALALIGGFMVARMVGGALAVILPLPRFDATALGVMLGYIAFAVAAVWAFAAGSLVRAVMGLAVPALAFGLLVFLLSGAGAA